MSYLHLAIWLVCLYDAAILLLLPSTVDIMFHSDGGAARYAVNLACLGIGAFALCKAGFKKIPNIWMAIFLIVMVISSAHSPNISFESLFVPKDSGIYNFKPMFEVLVFFMMFMGVYSLEVNEHLLKKTIGLVAFVSGAYIILQHFGLDQLYRLVSNDLEYLTHATRNPEAGAFIGQPVYAGCLLAIGTPFLLTRKKWLMAAVCVLAVFLTGNRTALAALLISACYVFKPLRKWAIWSAAAFIASAVALFVVNLLFPDIEPITFTGRMLVWKNILLDLSNNPFPGIDISYILTGLGIGSFPVTYPFYHHSGFYQAHNEYLELLRGMGILGAMVVFKVTQNIFTLKSSVEVMAAMIAVGICAFFNPVWHNPQIQFLTVLLLALYYKGEQHDMDHKPAGGFYKFGELRESEECADLGDFRFAQASI